MCSVLKLLIAWSNYPDTHVNSQSHNNYLLYTVLNSHAYYTLYCTVVQLGFQQADYTVSEGDGSAHVCIQLMQGSRCRRPVVIRVHTVQCDPGASGKLLMKNKIVVYTIVPPVNIGPTNFIIHSMGKWGWAYSRRLYQYAHPVSSIEMFKWGYRLIVTARCDYYQRNTVLTVLL